MIDKIIDWGFVASFMLLMIFVLTAIVLAAFNGEYLVAILLAIIIIPVALMVLITYAGASNEL